MASTNYNVISYDRIASTQTTALRMIMDGNATDKTVIMTASQTAGRGRGSHKWISHTGNLYASFIYRTNERRPTLSYSFAVAAAETLLSFNVPVQIKWPNDLLVDDKKISGMLLEYCQGFLVVGIGINIKSSPSVESYKTTKVNDYAKGLTVNKIAQRLMKNFDKWRDMDFPTVRNRWLELSIGINSPAHYRGKPVTFCGLNDEGAMVLRRGEKYELVYGDELFT